MTWAGSRGGDWEAAGQQTVVAQNAFDNSLHSLY